MLFEKLARSRDDRVRLAELEYEIEDLIKAFRAEVERRGLKEGTDAYESAYSGFHNDLDLLHAEINQIQTRRLLARAASWLVPIPPRPRAAEDDTEYWWWCRVHGTHYLTDRGRTHLRREVYQEIDLRYRQVPSWAALAISVISLVVSVLKP